MRGDSEQWALPPALTRIMAQKLIADPICSDCKSSESACSATAQHAEQLRVVGCAIAFLGFTHTEMFLSNLFRVEGKKTKREEWMRVQYSKIIPGQGAHFACDLITQELH